MPRRVNRDQAIAAVRRLVASDTNRSIFVGIDGFGAAGKSSLADAMAASIPGAEIVRTDDFAGPGVREWDWPRFREQVYLPLVAGRTARYRVWNWQQSAAGRWVEIPPGRPVLVEGVSATRSEAGVAWSLTIWVEAPLAVRRERILARDGEALLARWTDDWMPSEEAYVDREHPQEQVDLIVDGTELLSVDGAILPE
jgi:uridine kinase